MMKYTRVLILLSIMCWSWGCDSYLDINTNSNVPPSVSAKHTLASTELYIAVAVAGQLFNAGGFFAQYWTQSPSASQYRGLDSYQPKTNALDQAYLNLTRAIANLRVIKEGAVKEENWSLNLICVTLEVYSWQLLVDLYDNIPYTQAFDPTNLNPEFDSGESIYTDIIKQMEDALDKKFTNIDLVLYTDSDFLFGGDIDKWKAFARSLQLKLYMRTSFTGLYDPAKVDALLAEQDFIQENVTFTQFENTDNKRSPWFETEVDRLGGVNHVAGKTLVNYLGEYDDPRISRIYQPAAANRSYNGNWQGDHSFLNGEAASIRNFATPNIAFDQPSYLLTRSELNFFIAEVYAKKGDYTSAKTYYEEGITQSLATHAITGQDTLATTTYSWDTWEGPTPNSFESALKKIALQKWIALAKVNHIEAFFELNRTGYPAPSTLNPVDDRAVEFKGGELILSVESALGNSFPKRFFYPKQELDRNSKAPPQASSIALKIWWDQK